VSVAPVGFYLTRQMKRCIALSRPWGERLRDLPDFISDRRVSLWASHCVCCGPWAPLVFAHNFRALPFMPFASPSWPSGDYGARVCPSLLWHCAQRTFPRGDLFRMHGRGADCPPALRGVSCWSLLWWAGGGCSPNELWLTLWTWCIARRVVVIPRVAHLKCVFLAATRCVLARTTRFVGPCALRSGEGGAWSVVRIGFVWPGGGDRRQPAGSAISGQYADVAVLFPCRIQKVTDEGYTKRDNR